MRRHIFQTNLLVYEQNGAELCVNGTILEALVMMSGVKHQVWQEASRWGVRDAYDTNQIYNTMLGFGEASLNMRMIGVSE